MKRFVFAGALLGLWLMSGVGLMAAGSGSGTVIVSTRDSTEQSPRDSINGIYIPKDLKECFVQLDTLLSAEDKEVIRKLERSGEMVQFHHGLGMWIRNNWGLWNGSRLQEYFKKRGITHPDDMSGLILAYYYDWLNGAHEDWLLWMRKGEETSGK